MHNIAIFASGAGTNAENIVRHFSQHPSIKVRMLLSNNKNAYVHKRMKPFGIPSLTFGKEVWNEDNGIVEYLQR